MAASPKTLLPMVPSMITWKLPPSPSPDGRLIVASCQPWPWPPSRCHNNCTPVAEENIRFVDIKRSMSYEVGLPWDFHPYSGPREWDIQMIYIAEGQSWATVGTAAACCNMPSSCGGFVPQSQHLNTADADISHRLYFSASKIVRYSLQYFKIMYGMDTALWCGDRIRHFIVQYDRRMVFTAI